MWAVSKYVITPPMTGSHRPSGQNQSSGYTTDSLFESKVLADAARGSIQCHDSGVPEHSSTSSSCLATQSGTLMSSAPGYGVSLTTTTSNLASRQLCRISRCPQ